MEDLFTEKDILPLKRGDLLTATENPHPRARLGRTCSLDEAVADAPL